MPKGVAWRHPFRCKITYSRWYLYSERDGDGVGGVDVVVGGGGGGVCVWGGGGSEWGGGGGVKAIYITGAQYLLVYTMCHADTC